MNNTIPFDPIPNPLPEHWNDNPNIWVDAGVQVAGGKIYMGKAILYNFATNPPTQVSWTTFLRGAGDPHPHWIPQWDGEHISGQPCQCVLRIMFQTSTGPVPWKWAGDAAVRVNPQGYGQLIGLTYDADANPVNI